MTTAKTVATTTTTSPRARIGVVILAAGQSVRMGKIKQLLPWKNDSLLGHAIEVASRSKLGKVAVVLGANFEIIMKQLSALSAVSILENQRFALGQGTSVSEAARWAKTENLDGILVMLGDQPLLTPEILRKIMAATSVNSTTLVAAHYAGAAGVPAFFGSAYFEELITLVGEKGAKVLLKKYADQVCVVPVPEAELDLDTEAEYKLALRNS